MKQIEQVIEAPEDYQLSEAESAELANLETTVEQGLKLFLQVGEALCKIRAQRLYCAAYGTFSAYCEDRWQMTKTQVNRLIGAADVARDLTPIGVIPSSESVLRPLVSLPTERLSALDDQIMKLINYLKQKLFFRKNSFLHKFCR